MRLYIFIALKNFLRILENLDFRHEKIILEPSKWSKIDRLTLMNP